MFMNNTAIKVVDQICYQMTWNDESNNFDVDEIWSKIIILNWN